MGFPIEKLEFVQTQEDTEFHKPDPRVFEPALAQLAAKGITEKSEIVYIGDAIRDLVAARDAGIGFIGVTNGLTSIAEFQAEDVDVVEELVELL